MPPSEDEVDPPTSVLKLPSDAAFMCCLDDSTPLAIAIDVAQNIGKEFVWLTFQQDGIDVDANAFAGSMFSHIKVEETVMDDAYKAEPVCFNAAQLLTVLQFEREMSVALKLGESAESLGVIFYDEEVETAQNEFTVPVLAQPKPENTIEFTKDFRISIPLARLQKVVRTATKKEISADTITMSYDVKLSNVLKMEETTFVLRTNGQVQGCMTKVYNNAVGKGADIAFDSFVNAKKRKMPSPTRSTVVKALASYPLTVFDSAIKGLAGKEVYLEFGAGRLQGLLRLRFVLEAETNSMLAIFLYPKGKSDE